ncbi:MAG: HU family DNA-binding protein [Candidatus Kapaibacterium sp.]|nr:HU family DNA-binding protein [Candidatus Kapabacteria bacterium]
MNKADLVHKVAEGADIKKADAERAIKATFEAVSNELAEGGNVTLIGFGTFSVVHKQARTGKNPQTGEVIQIAAKKVAKFKPGKALAELVNPVPEPKQGKKKTSKKK